MGVNKVKPIYLLADSQLLFWKDEQGDSVLGGLPRIYGQHARVAYLGASNDYKPEFFDIFKSAMEGIGFHLLQSVDGRNPEDVDFLKKADVIVLAGGDTQAGWKAFQEQGLDEVIIDRYLNGSTLIGVSAGAVQLGLAGWILSDNGKFQVFPTFQLVPYLIGVHEEPDWTQLQQVLGTCAEKRIAFGIPAGGGAIIHPDLFVEPVRHPLMEIDEQSHSSLLYPPDEPKAIVERGEDKIRISEDAWSKMVH
ncbi:MAG: type 1 glutamine amidotransferase-like domain-containing protein [Methylococcales bacterium]|nr:type 1 glutamine amidotransferase-like domain-containing protein [Methylococcales bacterium]MBT7445510.1 type 1 glutamine amidotransferase-like domain-containing protein [Methylococcales bacterium]